MEWLIAFNTEIESENIMNFIVSVTSSNEI